MTVKDKSSSYEDFLADIEKVHGECKAEQRFLDGVTDASGAPDLDCAASLGERVRSIRDEKGLSLADVASRVGYDESFLERIEKDEVSPPLGVLIKLGRALDMKLGYFVSGGETRPYTVVRKEERSRISRRASTGDQAYGYTYEALAPGKTNRKMEPYLVTLEPAEEQELSSHEGQEFIYVVEGKMEAILGDDRMILNPGDTIYYDSSVPHMVRCIDGPHTTILAVLYAYDQ